MSGFDVFLQKYVIIFFIILAEGKTQRFINYILFSLFKFFQDLKITVLSPDSAVYLL